MKTRNLMLTTSIAGMFGLLLAPASSFAETAEIEKPKGAVSMGEV